MQHQPRRLPNRTLFPIRLVNTGAAITKSVFVVLLIAGISYAETSQPWPPSKIVLKKLTSNLAGGYGYSLQYLVPIPIKTFWQFQTDFTGVLLLTNAELVASAHGTANKLIIDAPRFRELMVPCVSSVDHVCAISPESVQECQEIFEIPRESISIEGYGYEPELFNYKGVDRFRVLRDTIKVDAARSRYLAVSVGKFVDWKGFKEFAVAIGHLRKRGYDIMAIIVGEGDPDSRAELEAFIAAKGLGDYVILPGKVDREVLPDIYRAGDLYVLPSHVEPYGLVLMEALACGTPAVAGNVGGPPSYVPQRLRGEGLVVLVDPIKLTPSGAALTKDREVYARSLADGMESILNKKIDPEDRYRIAEEMKSLNWSRLVESLTEIYDRLLRKALANEAIRGAGPV